MNTFFLETRDPLFGIIIFFLLIFVVASFSYWFTRFKKNDDQKQIDKFLKQFQNPPSQNELESLMAKNEMSEKLWLLLAHFYIKESNYEKGIEIYLQLLKIGNKSNYRETLFLLGKAYYKAGFLERSKGIFLEILKTNPRTPQALNYLLLVCEQMKKYSDALEILDSLEELQKETRVEKAYINTLIILNNPTIQNEIKAEKLLEIYKTANELIYIVFEFLFKYKPSLAWENLDISRSKQILDILWRCDLHNIDRDKVMQNALLKELYSAKGYMKESSRSSIFELDILINLESKASATIRFEYICANCKTVHPFFINRCSSCHVIGSLEPEMFLVKAYKKETYEESDSFL